MGDNLGGGAGGAGSSQARVRWATGCAGISGSGRPSSHLYFLLCCGGSQLFMCGVYGSFVESVFQILNRTDLVT